MINVEKFAKRLMKVMDHYEISAAILASKIGVQRSSISHILSGRNKPSLEFVLKILKAFPEVELYWLLNGTGSFPKIDSTPTPPEISEKTTDTLVAPMQKLKSVKESTERNTQEIERIVVFYKNGTFKNYKP